MQPYATFSICIVTSLAFVHIQKILCQNLACGEPFECGNLTAGYPFWGGQRPSSCGYPGLELSCQSEVAFLTFKPLKYRILAIDSTLRILTVARADLWSDICLTSRSNDTFDSDMLHYVSGDRNVTLSYDCVIREPNSKPRPNQCICPGNNITSFFSTDTIGFPFIEVSCNDNISVPVNQVAYRNLENSTDFQAAIKAGFRLQWKGSNTACDQCTRSGGRCGYHNGEFACHLSSRSEGTVYGYTTNNTGPSALPDAPGPGGPPDSQPGPSGSDNLQPVDRSRHGRSITLKLVLGISLGLVGLIVSVAGVHYLNKNYSSYREPMWWEKDKEGKQNIQEFMRNYGSQAPKCYSYSEVRRMTDSFAHQLGQGGYGSVYKGKLSDGRQVAVKVLRGNKGNGEEFINEVASISRTSHINVVTLLGFCYEANRRALIYDFMPNGSLDKFICRNESEDTSHSLEWKVLFQIAVGTARGLEYLHQGCNTRIVHFDIKPQNILLDDDFCPKISDFGLAKLCKKKQSILSTMGARGTVGYIAPEVVFRGFGGVSHKSDVYSYGMLVLEIVGLKNRIQVHTEKSSETYFPNWIYEHLELEKNLGLEGIMNEEEEEAAMKMIYMGLWCIQTKPSDRPSMTKVVEMLEGSIQSLQIPPKPYLLESPASIGSIQDDQESSETSFQ